MSERSPQSFFTRNRNDCSVSAGDLFPARGALRGGFWSHTAAMTKMIKSARKAWVLWG